jgi:formylglycine-generating enzyme required for sulfatase activity
MMHIFDSRDRMERLPCWWVWAAVATVVGVIMVALLAPQGETLAAGTPTPTPDPLDATFEAGDANHGWTPIEGEIGDDPFVYVPAGCFMMGSDNEQFNALMMQCVAYGIDEADCRRRYGGEQPDHRVCFSPFWIGQTEVTNAQYQRCVDAGVCAARSYVDDSRFSALDQPVVGVIWDDAQAYAEWLSGETGETCTLPTEAQWAYAARGPQAVNYPWGDDSPTCDLANYYGCVGPTSPVGGYSPAGDSWVGAADMAGNVWEWTADWYDSDYYSSVADGQLDPAGPDSGDYRVVRGGSFGDNLGFVRCAYRLNFTPDNRLNSIGIRVVCGPNPD